MVLKKKASTESKSKSETKAAVATKTVAKKAPAKAAANVTTAIAEPRSSEANSDADAVKKIAPKRTSGTKVPKKASYTQDDIAFRAWEIWQREGCPAGKEHEHWLQAEKELLGEG